MDELALYRLMVTIRRFEETVLEEFKRGVFSGTTHTYLGQEANAVGILSQIGKGDLVFSNHRCHGHFIAYGGSPHALFAELMGKATGVCAGRGGSQHLHWRNFFSSGVQGGLIPVAVGAALAEKRKNSGTLAVAFLGDGTFGQGVVYESFNLASLWSAPLLFVVENNHIAQTTPTSMVLTGEILTRFNAFDIPTVEMNSSDVLEIQSIAIDLLEAVRFLQSPRALIIHTERFGPHSKGDDTRSPAMLEAIRRERDPLAIHAPRLEERERQDMEELVERELKADYDQALADPWPVFPCIENDND